MHLVPSAWSFLSVFVIQYPSSTSELSASRIDGHTVTCRRCGLVHIPLHCFYWRLLSYALNQLNRVLIPRGLVLSVVMSSVQTHADLHDSRG